jgi:phosphatidate cytidylyltransferase
MSFSIKRIRNRPNHLINSRNLKELLIRTLSGLIYAVLMIGSITIHPLGFFGLFVFILIAGMTEFYRMASKPGLKPYTMAGTGAGVIIFTLTFLIHFLNLDPVWHLILIIPVLALLSASLMTKRENPVAATAVTFLGLIYVSVPVSLFNGIVYHPYHEGFDYQVGLFLFAVIWLNDTGAYLTGRLIGRHHIFPRVSPKKTWEGVAGGLVVAILASWLLKPLYPSIPINHIWILCPLIITAGTLGDFAESVLKRAAGVKDSGAIMPGHGGILDRMDSLIFAAPVVYLTINLLEKL